jgi:hypothetical protein
MAYPQTGSTIYNNRTGVALSTNIVIKVGNNAIGAIQSISIQESRDIKMIDEVGTDGHIDSAPSKSPDFSGSCTRIRFDRMRITEAFSRDFVHIKSQRIPFDIDIIDQWQGDSNLTIVTTLSNVWFSDMNYDYSSNDFIVSEKASFKAESIHSTFINGNGSVARGGGGGDRQITLDTNAVEQLSDSTPHRGSLDSPGLIKDIF